MAPLIPGELIPETGAPAASTGHRLRLADTNLILEVERDLSADATGQRQSSRAAGALTWMAPTMPFQRPVSVKVCISLAKAFDSLSWLACADRMTRSIWIFGISMISLIAALA